MPLLGRSRSTELRQLAVGGGGGSAWSSQDAYAVEAVDLDDLCDTDEMEVLATGRLPALRAPDPQHLDEVAVAGDVIACSDVTGKGHLGSPSSRWALHHAQQPGPVQTLSPISWAAVLSAVMTTC